jgi:hypothetical protein
MNPSNPTLRFFCDNRLKTHYENHAEDLPSTVAMRWCLHATSIDRIFEREHMAEFLFRLAFVLDSKRIFDNLIVNGYLFDYSYKGERYQFSIKDLEDHIGFQSNNSCLYPTTRERFFTDSINFISILSLGYAMNGFFLLEQPKKIGNDIIADFDQTKILDQLPSNDQVFEQKAALFVSEVMKDIDFGVFNKENKDMQTKLLEFEERRKIASSIPEFDYDKIPMETRYHCMQASFSEEEAREVLENPDDEDIQYRCKVFLNLAWLFANNLMVIDPYTTADPVEGVYLDDEDYDEGDGYNLLNYYDQYNLEAMAPLLKGLFFDESPNL